MPVRPGIFDYGLAALYDAFSRRGSRALPDCRFNMLILPVKRRWMQGEVLEKQTGLLEGDNGAARQRL